MFWAGYILGCLICGAISYALIEGKGYEKPTGWFLAGFLLGIFGVILALVHPSQTNNTSHSSKSELSEQSNSSNSPVHQNTITCRSCGAINSTSSSHCQSCGTSLSSLKINNNDNKWKCSCGAMNYYYETSCHRCGEKKPHKNHTVQNKGITSPTSAAPSPAQKSITDQLEELKKLQDQGLITEADFEAKKKQILGI